MSDNKNKLKEFFGELKNMFQKFEAPADTPAVTVYKLEDGKEVMIDKLEAGGVVKEGDNPVAAGEYKLEDGTTLMVGENGVISEVKPKEQPAAAASAATVDMSTPEGLRSAYDKFATGTPEERLGNLETLCKAMMEYCFGWQLREAQAKQTTDEAIKVYKELTDTAVADVATSKQLMGKMLELMEQFIDAPVTDVPTATKKKFSFSKIETHTEQKKGFSAALSKLQEEYNKN